MVQQLNGAIATKYERMVTSGHHTIGIYYPKPMEFKPRIGSDYIYSDSIWTLPSVPAPSLGWERNLNDAVRSLQNPTHKVSDIIDYLPEGTLIKYQPNGQNPNGIPTDRIPIEVGIAKEVIGDGLESVVDAVELWL